MPDFSELARAFLAEEYAESPTGASSLGLIQYDDQLPDLSEAGLKDHFFWGLLLLIFLMRGPGKLSLDYLIRRRFMGTAA